MSVLEIVVLALLGVWTAVGLWMLVLLRRSLREDEQEERLAARARHPAGSRYCCERCGQFVRDKEQHERKACPAE